jgi:hypothetical protein
VRVIPSPLIQIVVKPFYLFIIASNPSVAVRLPGTRLTCYILGLEPEERQPPADVFAAAGLSDAVEQHRPVDNDPDEQEGAGPDDGYPQMTEKQKKLFELRLKMVRRVADFACDLPTIASGLLPRCLLYQFIHPFC